MPSLSQFSVQLSESSVQLLANSNVCWDLWWGGMNVSLRLTDEQDHQDSSWAYTIWSEPVSEQCVTMSPFPKVIVKIWRLAGVFLMFPPPPISFNNQHTGWSRQHVFFTALELLHKTLLTIVKSQNALQGPTGCFNFYITCKVWALYRRFTRTLRVGIKQWHLWNHTLDAQLLQTAALLTCKMTAAVEFILFATWTKTDIMES